jgi:hypothetical protein
VKRFLLPVALVGARVLSAAGGASVAQLNGSIASAVHELYDARFDASRQTLREYSSIHPGDPLAYALKAATYLFSELSFLSDNRKVEDPQVAAALNEAVKQARKQARNILAVHPGNRNALLAACIASGVQRDHLALAEHKLRESYPFMRESQIYATRLLKVDPTAYDAYLTKGFTEYIVGELPFYYRWLMKLDGVTGTKRQGLDDLRIAAESGQYMKPFAQLLLARLYLQEKQGDKAEQLLAQLTEEYPDNATFREEWRKWKTRHAAAL